MPKVHHVKWVKYVFLSEILNFEIETKEKIAFKSHDILTLFIHDQFDQ